MHTATTHGVIFIERKAEHAGVKKPREPLAALNWSPLTLRPSKRSVIYCITPHDYKCTGDGNQCRMHRCTPISETLRRNFSMQLNCLDVLFF